MTDTDPKMMRGQQDKDTRQRIEPDETLPSRDRRDSDAASGTDRKAAKAGRLGPEPGSQDAVLAQNRRSDYSAEASILETGDIPEKPPLAQRDRSLLGN